MGALYTLAHKPETKDKNWDGSTNGPEMRDT